MGRPVRPAGKLKTCKCGYTGPIETFPRMGVYKKSGSIMYRASCRKCWAIKSRMDRAARGAKVDMDHPVRDFGGTRGAYTTHGRFPTRIELEEFVVVRRLQRWKYKVIAADAGVSINTAHRIFNSDVWEWGRI